MEVLAEVFGNVVANWSLAKSFGWSLAFQVIDFIGDPGGSRTPDIEFRKLQLTSFLLT
jgi:hypothetical protein